MPDPTKKPIPAALTDPMLNASRELGLKVNPAVLNNFNVNSQVQYHNNIGNPNGVAKGQPIIDLASAYRELPQIIQAGADTIETKTIDKAKTTVAKAAGVALLQRAEVIGASSANRIIKSIYDGTRAFLGKPALSIAAGAVSFSPSKFATDVAKSVGFQMGGLNYVDKGLTAAEIGAAAAGPAAATAYRTALQRGYGAIGGAIESAGGAIGSVASKVRLPTIAAVMTPTTMGDSTIDGMIARQYRERNTDSLGQWKQDNDYLPSGLDINAYQTAEFERWKERDDKIQQQRIEEAKKANINRVNESMSSTGFKDDHISAYFKNKA